MAGVGLYVDTGSVTLTASTPKTIAQVVAATNQRVKILRMDVSSDGITAADPGILFEWLVQGSAGTMSALTPAKARSSDTESLQTTAQKTATGEPSTTTLLGSVFYNEQTWIPFIFDPPLEVVGGTRMGFRATPGTLTGTTHVAVTLYCEE